MINILIVEDDIGLRMGLTFDLTQEGYTIISAENGEKAISMLKNNINLVLLDVNLPDNDGFTLCKKIKSIKNVPIIFLTAHDLEQDELLGFECGADDYITKPFSMLILRKRILSVLKRYSSNRLVYVDGFLTIDFNKLTASIDNQPINFTPTEYKLLKILISNKGNVLTKQILLEKLWDNNGNFVDEHTLTVNINRLRNKIEDNSHKYIKTIYGIGYLWIGESI